MQNSEYVVRVSRKCKREGGSEGWSRAGATVRRIRHSTRAPNLGRHQKNKPSVIKINTILVQSLNRLKLMQRMYDE